MPSFSRTDSANTDFLNLVALLDKELAIRDGDEHAFYAQFNKSDSIRNVIVCYVENKPAGIGAFKKYEAGKAEIKRMFVLPVFRGQGIALQILQRLEKWAAEEGFSECILETGKKQPEAINLYHKAGYKNIPNYGQYAGVENSVCMAKKIR
jgi:GNAT superfamily N-acetyltransferase